MFTRYCLLILVALSLLILLAPACGGGGDDETPTVTTPADTRTPTPTTAPGGKPVKIGVINAWSGAQGLSGLLVDQALAVVEKQIEERGGILGGRPVKFVKYDNKSEVALSAAGAQKLILEDEVSVLTLGGVGGAQVGASAGIAKEHKMLLAGSFDTSSVDRDENKFFVPATPALSARHASSAEMVLELKPESFACLFMDEDAHRAYEKKLTQAMEAAGIKVVYSEFVPLGTRDMAPYLTRIKYENPDVLFLSLDNEQTLMVAKQIVELGFKDDIQVLSESPALTAKKLKGTVGWIVMTPWDPSSDYPASVKFVEDYQAIHGNAPNPNHVYFYNPLWLAVHAIELAGTDNPEDIAKAARSGNLEFDTPMGMAHIGTDGDPNLGFMMVQIQEGGKLVPYP